MAIGNAGPYLAAGGVVALAAALVPPPAFGDGMRLTVGARILTFARITNLRQAPAIAVTQADIDRGYVEVRSGTRFDLTSNTGSYLTLRPRGGWFRSMKVTGLPRPIVVGPDGESRLHLPAFRQPYGAELSLRFELAPGVRPGTFPWTMALSILPG